MVNSLWRRCAHRVYDLAKRLRLGRLPTHSMQCQVSKFESLCYTSHTESEGAIEGA
jgi:hypothetical protein